MISETFTTTTVGTSTAIPITTEHVCDENMDEYGEVDVTRSVEAGDDLDDDDWWTPSSGSNTSSPYEGSPLTIATTSPGQITSLLVERQDDDNTTIRVAVRVKPSGSEDFEPVLNPDNNSTWFEVTPGEKIPLPEGIPVGSVIEVYVIEPVPDSPLSVTPFGCKPPGKCYNDFQ